MECEKTLTNHKPLFLYAFFPFLLFQMLVSFLPLLYASLPLSNKNDSKLVSSSVLQQKNLLQIFDVIAIEIAKHAYHSYLLLGPKLVSFCHIRIFMYIRFFVNRSLLKRYSNQNCYIYNTITHKLRNPMQSLTVPYAPSKRHRSSFLSEIKFNDLVSIGLCS